MVRLPTRLPTPVSPLVPRSIRRRKALGGGIWAGRLIILPHTLIGMGLIVFVFVVLGWIMAGTDTRGLVIKKFEESDEGKAVYKVRYTFDAGDKAREDTTTLERAQWAALTESSPEADARSSVRVRYLRIGPWVYSNALGEGESVWGALGFAVVFAGFWNGIVFLFVYFLWIAPYRGRRLYKWGQAVPGVIVSIRNSRPRKVEYEFESAGQTCRGRMSVSDGNVSVNEAVTVLHKPGNPRKSVIYEYGQWECVA